MKTDRFQLLAFLLLILYFLPILLLGENSFWEGHDSLDYYVAMLRAADLSGDLWNLNPNSTVDAILGGIPRFCFHNNFDMLVLLYSILPPYLATLANFILVHLIGFWGMDRLLRNHLQPELSSSPLTAFSALTFSTLPLYPMLGISFSGIPLLLYAILNLVRNRGSSAQSYILIALFLFYSSFVYIGVFILFALTAAAGWSLLRKYQWHFPLIRVLLVMGSGYALLNYHLLYQFLLAADFQSNREIAVSYSYNFKIVLWAAWNMLIKGHYHAESLHTGILVFAIPSLWLAFRNKYEHRKLLLLLLITTIVISGFYGFWQWDALQELKQKSRLLSVFRWDRFYFFNPALWSLIFALGLGAWSIARFRIPGRGMRIASLLLAIQLLYQLFSDKVWIQNLTGMTENLVPLSGSTRQALLDKEYLDQYENKRNSYRGYYQEDLFKEVQKKIGQPQNSYRVAALGFNPTILQYNGFYTIDGYLTSYPLPYKLKFRKIIRAELEKSQEMKNYFDNWGSRCYLYSSESWNGESKIKNLELDTTALKDLQCKYIFSATEVMNYSSLGWDSLASFHSRVNEFKLIVYKVR